MQNSQNEAQNERRRFPRQDVRHIPIRATLVISGESLLSRGSNNNVEIDAKPLDLSQSGASVSLILDATWDTISPTKQMKLILGRKRDHEPLDVRVVHVRTGNRLGLEFVKPLEVSKLITPQELI